MSEISNFQPEESLATVRDITTAPSYVAAQHEQAGAMQSLAEHGFIDQPTAEEPAQDLAPDKAQIEYEEQAAWDEYDKPAQMEAAWKEVEGAYDDGPADTPKKPRRATRRATNTATGRPVHRRAQRGVTTVGEAFDTKPLSNETEASKTEIDLPEPVTPTEELKDTKIETPFAMWEPVIVREERPKRTAPVQESNREALRGNAYWTPTQLAALEGLKAAYRAKNAKYEAQRKPKAQKATEAAAWILERQSPDVKAAVDAVAERFAQARRDYNMVPEAELGDDPWAKSLSEEQRKAYDNLTYRTEQKRRQQAEARNK